MKKFWWGVFFAALIGVLILASDSRFSDNVRNLFKSAQLSIKDIIGILLLQGTLLAALVGALFQGTVIPFLSKKAENAATKQDIAGITERIEEVKVKHDKAREENKTENSLRIANISKRFHAHQEAYELCWKLGNLPVDTTKATTEECDAWWAANCLYLDEKAREPFFDAICSAHAHLQLLGLEDEPRHQESLARHCEMLLVAQEAIQRSVGLPPIALGSMPEASKKQDTETCS